MLELSCNHGNQVRKRFLFASESGGNYTVDLCRNCEIKEDMKFLIKELPVDITIKE